MNAGRLEPESWRKLAPAYADWPVAEVAVPARPAALDDEPTDDRLLAWCREAAISELTSGHSAAADRPGPDWRTALKAVRRERLDPRLRPVLDDLLIDALSRSGEWDELHARLALIPPVECRPRVWAALETGAMFRLARAARDPDAERGFVRRSRLWDEVIRLAWPAESGFPAQFIKRVEVMAGSDPHRLESWRDRLRRAVADLGGRSGRFHHAAAVAAARAGANQNSATHIDGREAVNPRGDSGRTLASADPWRVRVTTALRIAFPGPAARIGPSRISARGPVFRFSDNCR